MNRVGVFSGTFDPVHAGHIAFALQAMTAAKLDKLYFLPERKPRTKQGTEHFAHRLAMLKAAVRPYPDMDVLEFDDISFSVRRTLPKLRIMFSGAQLVLLVGSDVVPDMITWPLIGQLFSEIELVVGMRENQTVKETRSHIAAWQQPPKTVTLINAHAPDVSSSSIRAGIGSRKQVKGLLKSVAKYSNRHWLYVSFGD